MKFFHRLKRFGKTAGDDRLAYRNYQYRIGKYYLDNYVKPYASGTAILDVGCAEGGVLEVFSQAGYQCTGLEYSEHRIHYAEKHSTSEMKFISGNIEEVTIDQKFDVILMLDVIEHLQKKETALQTLKNALLPEGVLIISFPPFKSAFGGHQQVMSSFLQFIPFLHLLPEKIYRWLLEHVEKKNVESHFRNYTTGITIKQFEQLIQRTGLIVKKKFFHLVRPRQAFRFGIKIRKNSFPFFREYLSSGAIYILGVSSSE